ncbi:hypothetical protein M8818_000341 [Zalaria obscura]|uniref:Uncharacterized protein n=1 Tax=Zalaria obscura TaxID=2024903 RepID=A0ACC3SN40_9PEZI
MSGAAAPLASRLALEVGAANQRSHTPRSYRQLLLCGHSGEDRSNLDAQSPPTDADEACVSPITPQPSSQTSQHWYQTTYSEPGLQSSAGMTSGS